MEMSAGVAGAAGELPLPSFSVDVTRFWTPFFFWIAPNADLGRLVGFQVSYTHNIQGDNSACSKPPVDIDLRFSTRSLY